MDGVSGQFYLREPPDETADGFLAFEAGQCRPKAVMDTATERDMLAGVGPAEVQLVGPVTKLLWIAVG